MLRAPGIGIWHIVNWILIATRCGLRGENGACNDVIIILAYDDDYNISAMITSLLCFRNFPR